MEATYKAALCKSTFVLYVFRRANFREGSCVIFTEKQKTLNIPYETESFITSVGWFCRLSHPLPHLQSLSIAANVNQTINAISTTFLHHRKYQEDVKGLDQLPPTYISITMVTKSSNNLLLLLVASATTFSTFPMMAAAQTDDAASVANENRTIDDQNDGGHESNSPFLDDVDCNNECTYGSGTFCGIDGQCHDYSCSNWFRYGPKQFDFGENGDGSTEASEERSSTATSESESLFCNDIPLTSPGSDDPDDVFYSSVSFRCRSLTPSPIAMGFNRKCTTKTEPDDLSGLTTSGFTCYELADNTDFGPFLETVDAATTYNCTDDEYDETGYPQFTYNVVYQTTIGNHGIGVFIPGFNGTAELDPFRAVNGAMYAIYEEVPTDAPTVSPTVSPTTSMPTFSSANSIFVISSHSSTTVAIISAVAVILGYSW